MSKVYNGYDRGLLTRELDMRGGERIEVGYLAREPSRANQRDVN